MSQFIESICIIDGVVRNLNYHQKRLNRTRYKVLGLEDEMDLNELISSQPIPQTGKFKCRIVYGKSPISIEFLPYKTKNITSLRLVENNEVDYSYKFLDRKAFELMSDSVDEDEILIVQNGQITDTSYSNIVFYDGENWITPETFLLNGTMRQSLLASGRIIEEEINPKDLNRFISFKLINAMMDLDESKELPISIIC